MASVQERAKQFTEDKDFVNMFLEESSAMGDMPAESDQGYQTWLKDVQEKIHERMLRSALSKQEPQQNDDGTQSIMIQPTAGYVLKTQNALGKVLINMCHTAEIDAPGTVLMENGEEQMRFPISVEGPRPHEDKQGGRCILYDCCINSTTYQAGEDDPEMKVFIIQQALNYIKQSKDPNMDATSLKFPKAKSAGKIGIHRIRKSAKKVPGQTMVQEVDSTPAAEPSTEPADSTPPLAEANADAPSKSARKSVTFADDQPAADAEAPANTDLPYEFAMSGVVLPRNGKYDWQAHGLDSAPNKSDVANLACNDDENDFSLVDVAGAPAELKLEIDCSGVPRKALGNEVNVWRVKVSNEVDDRLLLSVRLPFPVDPNRSCAKFKKSTNKLMLNLPVDMAVIARYELDRRKQAAHQAELEADLEASIKAAADAREKEAENRRLAAEERAEAEARARKAVVENYETERQQAKQSEVEADKRAAEIVERVQREAREWQAEQDAKDRAAGLLDEPEESDQKHSVEHVGNTQKIKELFGVDLKNRYVFALDY